MTVYVPGGGGGGSPAFTIQTVTTSTTLTATGNLLVLASGAITITLPLSSTNIGATINIRRRDNNGSNISVVPQGSDTIDGDASRGLNYSPGGQATAGNQYLQCSLTSTGAGYVDNYNNMLVTGIHAGPGKVLNLSGDGSGCGYATFSGGSFGGPALVSTGGQSVVLQGGLVSQTGQGIQSGASGTLGGSYYSGSGVPAAGLGNNGDLFLRTDTPGTANQRLYIKSAGAWVAIL